MPALIREATLMVRAIDLFCGGGGSSWGAQAAGAELVGAVDAWDVAARTYSDNFPGAVVVNTRLSDESGPEIFGDIGQVDLLIASPECTHHSIARGAKPRCDESRRSGWYVMRFIREMRPQWIVLENVAMMRNWEGFRELKTALEDVGYLLTIQTLDAADFGVPQARRRLFIMGELGRKPDEVTVPPSHPLPASTILDEPGTWPAKHAFDERRAEATAERIRAGIAELGEGEDFLVVYYSSDRAGGWQPLTRPLRTLTTLDRFGLVSWVEGIPRLRMLQLPELRRAMGFGLCPRTGREYRLEYGSRRDRVKILGNGVCPPVMQHVIECLTGIGCSLARAA
ncbi:DNA cytosine methyltransferase [Salinarimonas ramus]|uniref:DNA (cytosine-5-)-methyltransferase n=1 Tax=Salinarimonas ramus TaxID=690164 RepID=A0A917QIQ4_9HYPH|nr:DNA cytosine methyltransferase [Salinarimonas ramus]GGK52556.1 DNA methyltransferase [Salinarimonas ramus]